MRVFAILVLSLSLLPAAQAADEADIAGQYELVTPPQPVADPQRVEVLEVFWYRCPHCNAFQPYVERYLASKPDYVNFRRMPAVLRDSWVPQARIYYVAEALGELERLHARIFEAVHKERRALASRADIKAFFEENGVSGDKFDAAWDSFAIDTQIRQADALSRRYGITGVPTVIVNGRYRTSGQLAGSYDRLLEVIAVLVEKERARIGN